MHPHTIPATPLHLRTKVYGTERIDCSAQKAWRITFGDPEEAPVYDIPKGIGQVLVQGRMCGDYYVELNGPGLCRASVGATPDEALRSVLEAA